MNTQDPYVRARHQMVDEQLIPRGIKDERVLTAMRTVHRHAFVPETLQGLAYTDGPLNIGEEQTISQPYIVGYMTEMAKLSSSSRVLEIGTGSGYQTAVLAELCQAVYSIEIIEELATQAADRLNHLGYKNIQLRLGDGYSGWAEEAPFDAILLTAAPKHIPQPLLDQLKVGGCMIVPVGKIGDQKLMRLVKTGQGIVEEFLFGVRFVPMTGEADGEVA